MSLWKTWWRNVGFALVRIWINGDAEETAWMKAYVWVTYPFLINFSLSKNKQSNNQKKKKKPSSFSKGILTNFACLNVPLSFSKRTFCSFQNNCPAIILSWSFANVTGATCTRIHSDMPNLEVKVNPTKAIQDYWCPFNSLGRHFGSLEGTRSIEHQLFTAVGYSIFLQSSPPCLIPSCLSSLLAS